MKELSFDPKTHTYTLNGMVIPSVTQLMKPLSNAKYGAIDESTLRAKAEKGTAVHEAIEFHIAYGAIDCPSDLMGYFNAYLAWRDDYLPRIVMSEQAVYHPAMLYAGTMDLLAVIGDRNVLIDVKTTSQINDMLTSVQLEAYERAAMEHGIEVDEKAVLQLMPDGRYKFKLYRAHDAAAWQTFAALMTIQAHINKYGG